MPLNINRLISTPLPKLRINHRLELMPQLLRFRDPTAESIEFAVTRRDDRFRARVRVTGTIRNRGNTDFSGDARQAGVYLYQDNKVVAHRSFGTLRAGQTLTVTFDRDWNSSSPAEGEFPPTYKLLIGYDPDIFIDGNPGNDDAVTTNNRITRSGADINRLIDSGS